MIFTLSYSIQQNLFSKSPGVNSSVVPLTQGQVIMNANASTATQAGSSTQSVVSATSTTSTSTVSSSNSAAAGLQRLAAQSQTQQQNNISRLSVKLRCQHCSRLFATKPELLDYKVSNLVLYVGYVQIVGDIQLLFMYRNVYTDSKILNIWIRIILKGLACSEIILLVCHLYSLYLWGNEHLILHREEIS